MSALIELLDVHKAFGAAPAADGLNLTIVRGECVVLLGPSGSGKSTALKLINRLVEPDRGEVLFDGCDVRSFAPEVLRRQMGYAIQSIGLFPHWTVARNVGTVPTLLGWRVSRVEARIDEFLALLGLEPAEFRHRYPHQLSGGQQQRVGVARALAAEPQVLLMDEPFGALDPLTRQELQRELARLQRKLGQTLVLVTHDVDEALRLATRIVLMQRGRIVQEATPLELLRRPANAWVAEFIGRADIGLRLLGLHSVAERMRPLAPGSSGGPEDEVGRAGDASDADGARTTPLSPGSNLRDALAEFLAQRSEWLPVADARGQRVGELHLPDLLEREA